MDGNTESIDKQGNSDESGTKKSSRVRGLTSLSAIRKEIVRVYSDARAAGALPEKVQFYRALTYILSAAAQVRKDEALDGIEARISALESKESNKGAY